MRNNRALFCLSAFVSILLSFIVVHYSSFSSSTSNTAIGPAININHVGILSKIVRLSGAEDFVSLLTSIARRHHHHREHREKCDKSKWDSRLISDYNVTLVLTVGLRGCANFSSVQKAVDAVPEFSTSRTLIIIDSGTYRLLPLQVSNILKSFSFFPFLFLNKFLFILPNTTS